MIRSVFEKVAWVGRTASMVFGLALVMALVVGAASTAMGATGGNFILGNANVATTVSKLTASISGPALSLVNNSTGTAATALNLTVASGKPPMKVSAGAGTVTNLDADKVDGKEASDFYAAGSKVADSAHADNATNAANADQLGGKGSNGFVSSSYFVNRVVDNSATTYTEAQVLCDEGDLVLGGGYNGLDANEGTVVSSTPSRTGMGDGTVRDNWYIVWKNASPGVDSNVIVQVFCADLGAAH